jgi:hypothetical protein
MSLGRTGKAVQEVDRDTERELDRIKGKVAKAEAVLGALYDERDAAISRAYMGGVNKNRISTLVGVTPVTVRASLRRSGAIDE